MVKITDPNEQENRNKQNNTKPVEETLTPELIKEMLKNENKQDTTPVNIRLETSIADQIERYAKEHDTTKTEVIKEVLVKHYSNRKITKGTFKLKEPVTLIIPHSKELIAEYMRKEINIISTVWTNSNNESTINPLDPQAPLYKYEGEYEFQIVNKANNLLDMFNPIEGYYSFSLYEYNKNLNYEIVDFIEDGVINGSEYESYPFLFHRGLMYIDIKINDNITALLIDVLCSGNELIRAVIVDTERAIELARNTKNIGLITFIHSIEDYVEINETVNYDRTNKELREENRNLKRLYTDISGEYENLVLEHEGLLNSLKSDFNEKQDNNFINYTESLEIQNKKLQDKIKEYEEREQLHREQIEKLREVLGL